MKFLRAIFAAILAGLSIMPLTVLDAMAQETYRLQPGDVVRIEVLEDGNLNRDALVLPDGRISLPLAGAIAAAGRTIEQIQSDVTNRLAPNFAAPPTVFVTLSQLAVPKPPVATTERTISIFLMGEAANPGKIAVTAGSTVLQALAQSGGFSPFAAKKRIQLRRDGTVYNLNYQTVEKAGVGAGFDTVLAEGDVIVIPTRRLFE